MLIVKDNTTLTPHLKKELGTEKRVDPTNSRHLWLIKYAERNNTGELALGHISFSIKFVCPHSFAVRNNNQDSISFF